MGDVREIITACPELKGLALAAATYSRWSVKTWMTLAEFCWFCPALCEVVLHVRGVQVAEQSPQPHLFHDELTPSGRQLLLRSVRT